ncbi:MAG: OmpA family protein [Actinoplanes sp.]
MRRLSGVIAAVLFGGLLAGCPGPDDSRALDCKNLERADAEGRAQAGSTRFLVDVTASARGTGEVPDYAAALKPQIQAAITRGDVVSVGSFDGSSASVRWSAGDRFARLTKTRDENREVQTDHFTSCLQDDVRTAQQAQSLKENTDIAGAIGVAVGPAAPVRTVVVATDGIGTSGCVDLAGGPAGKIGWIDEIVEQCPRRVGWPVQLRGANLVMIGVGHPAAGVPVPSTGNVEFLRQLWESICLVAKAASCHISTEPIAMTTGTGPAAHPDRAVRFAEDPGAPPAPTGITFAVDQLFATDSAVVLAPGQAIIRQQTATLPDSVRIKVIGYADARGTEEHNLELSRERAENVAALLRTRFSDVTWDGVGERDAQCSRPELPGGRWNEPCLSRDRKIVLSAEVV